MTRIGNFFKKIGRGIKRGAKAVWGVAKKAVGFIPKVLGMGQKAATALSGSGNEKLQKIGGAIGSAVQKGSQVYDKGKAMADQHQGLIKTADKLINS